MNGTTRYLFVVFTTALLLTPRVSHAAEASADKPNIILFIADDHGWRDSGVYGDKVVRTPNIDQLARQGMRFAHAFAASPLCSPSRCVIETGLMPFRNGGHKFNSPIRPGVKTLPAYFKERGYYTAEVGKFHHPPANAFPYDLVDPAIQKAADFIERYDRKQSLLLVVCAYDPHQPWAKNKSYDPAQVGVYPNFIDTVQTRKDRTDYYTSVERMDTTLGRVLKAIDARGMRDNTLFVYTSDQGASWPFGKWCVYDSGLHVPFIVRWPGKVVANCVTDAMVSQADLVPTFLKVAGENPPADLDGRSFLKVLTGETTKHRDVVFGTHTGNDGATSALANYNPARTIITAKYQYVLNLAPEREFTSWITAPATDSKAQYQPFWPTWVEKAKTDQFAAQIVNAYLHRAREELYDLSADPFEMHNLANDPRHAEQRRALRQQLSEWCKQQGDSEPLVYLKP